MHSIVIGHNTIQLTLEQCRHLGADPCPVQLKVHYNF